MDNDNTPLLIMLAGPNGAGKSTFYDNFIKNDCFLSKIERVCYDDISKANPDDDWVEAGLKTLNMVGEHIKNRKSFLYETTGSDFSSGKFMKMAKNNGFQTALIFIGIDSAELSAARVKNRVADGGHDVLAAEDIFNRYPLSLKKLPDLMELADFSILFDNSGKAPFLPVLIKDCDNVKDCGYRPKWFEKISDHIDLSSPNRISSDLSKKFADLCKNSHAR